MNMGFGASSSTVSSFNFKRHDVFLSFRGEDVRKTFLSHLYHALSRHKIETYKDDAKLEAGDDISQSLLKAIEESKLSVVVFSKNYASSSWCLGELVHILKCSRENGHCIIPVFHDVEPSHVRKQEGSYAVAFIELAKRFGIDKIFQWKDALKSATNLVGLSSLVTSNESDLVDKIVVEVRRKLNRMSPISYDFNNLVGIHDRVNEIQSLLRNGSPEVRILGIWGMGGIGKTTLASIVFNRIFSQFESSYFLANVSDEMSHLGYTSLRSKLLAGLLEEDNNQYLELRFVKERLRRKKVLIVLDDVSSLDQFNKLLLRGLEFGHESRIIVTSRNFQVVEDFEVYKVKEMNDNEALQLFLLKVFGESSCPVEYREMSEMVVKSYAKGIPFALESLGFYFRSKSEKEWKSALDKLKRTPYQEVQEMLKVSYDGLDPESKEIFLDIACFFKGEDRDFVERIVLDGSNPSSHIGIKDLIDRSLITIRPHNKLWMHHLIQQMGQAIVLDNGLKSPCRLWDADGIYEVLQQQTNTGTEVIEGIFLDTSKIENELRLSRTVFSNMRKLRFLKIYSSGSVKKCKVYLPQRGLRSLPKSLTYLYWHNYPGKYLPPNFTPKNLVELSMPYSHVEKLWNEDQNLRKLKRINLSYSEQLTQVQDLSRALHVESINLECCRSLLQVPQDFQNLHMLASLNLNGCSSLQQLLVLPRNLTFLNIKNCTELESIPTNIYELKSLSNLDLSGCSNLKNFPEILTPMECLMDLILDRTAIEKFPSSIGNLVALNSLSLDMCENLEDLPDSISKLFCLQSLSLRHCPKLRSLPALPPSLPSVDARGCTSLQTVFSSKAVTEGWNCSHHNGGTFTFYDCLNLDFSAQNNIMADAGLRIMHIANATSNYGRDQDMTEICWSGNKIPKWFKHQSEESSVNIVLASCSCVDQTFLGFVFCVVIDFIDCNLHNGDLKSFCESHCILPDGFSSAWRWSWIWHWKYHVTNYDHMNGRAETIVNSPHVFLFYKNMSPRDFESEDCDNKSINIKFEFYSRETNCAVRRCGVRLLHGGDIKKLSFLGQEEEESVDIEKDEQSISIVEEDVESIGEEESNEIESISIVDSQDEEQEENRSHLEQNGSPHLEDVISDKRKSVSRCLQKIFEFCETSIFSKRSFGNVTPETTRLIVTSSQSAVVQEWPLSGHEELVKRLDGLQDQNTKIWQCLLQLRMTTSMTPPEFQWRVPQANS